MILRLLFVLDHHLHLDYRRWSSDIYRWWGHGRYRNWGGFNCQSASSHRRCNPVHLARSRSNLFRTATDRWTLRSDGSSRCHRLNVCSRWILWYRFSVVDVLIGTCCRFCFLCCTTEMRCSTVSSSLSSGCLLAISSLFLRVNRLMRRSYWERRAAKWLLNFFAWSIAFPIASSCSARATVISDCVFCDSSLAN